MFCKTTVICSAKALKDFLKTCWGVSCKTTKRFSAKILKRAEKTLKCVLQKYRDMFCKTDEESSTLWHKMNNFLVKTQGLGMFHATS